MRTLIRPQRSNSNRSSVIQRVTLVGAAMDAVLSVGKLAIGTLVGSPAVFADGVHSLSDLVTDGFVLLINKFAHNAPDQEHPYGHARFETLGTVLLGITLFLVGLGLGFEYINQLTSSQENNTPNLLAISIIVVSLIGKEWQFHYTLKAAKKVESSMLAANAWHSRSDALSSLVVLGGLIAAYLGYGILEIVSALFVAILIGKMGFKLSWNALQELADRGLNSKQHADLVSQAESVKGVKNVHMLRSRLMSNYIFIDLHIEVDNELSVSEGHQIGEWAMADLRENFPNIKDITLHIDFENDELECILQLAPLRHEILDQLKKWPTLTHYTDIRIHYHHQLVKLVLYFDAPVGSELNMGKLMIDANACVEETEWLEIIEIISIVDKKIIRNE